MLELLTSAEMAEADRLAIAGGVKGIDLMENAGRAVAECAARLSGRRVLVVAGPGNNGGDGFVAGRILHERGYYVRLCLVGEKSKLKGDAALAADRWPRPTEPATPDLPAQFDIVIDALFGAGLDRDVEGLPRAMIEAINASGAEVVAVDLPSGVNGTTGAVMGVAVEANRTVTFFRRKTGHLLLPGRVYCGETLVSDIGIPAGVLEVIRPRAYANEPPLWGLRFPRPATEGHKYSRGHAVVVSGGVSSTGAARLAGRGALRIGAGLVTIASPREALEVNAKENLAVMVRPVDGAGELTAFLADKRRNAVVLGPGGGVGAAMQAQVMAALASEAAVVLDADALTSFAKAPELLADGIKNHAGGGVVLTPHEGEFRRISGAVSDNPHLKSKHEKARVTARNFGAVVVLKGGDTVVAAPDGRVSIAANAPPTLATAGSGDVLAGMLAGLFAQGMEPFEAASAAVWLHGEAAKEFGPGLISEDLPDMLPRALEKLLVKIGP
jgi:hydroxyethylthiazole kinase-like uncharacterized protein yjeF